MTREEALAALATMTEDDFPTVSPEEDADDAFVERLIEAGRKATDNRRAQTADDGMYLTDAA